MKVVIIGAGFTGVELAKRLIADNCEVTLVDNDENIISHAAGILDCATIASDGNDLETLKSAGVGKADALICLTHSDEINMITCSLADGLWPEVLKIARVRNYAYYVNTEEAGVGAGGRKLYGVDFMIHPDVEASLSIVRAVNNRAVGNIIDFDNSEMQIAKVPVLTGSTLAGVRLMDLKALCNFPMLVVYIEQDGETFLPSGTTVIEAQSFLGVITKKEDLPKVTELCGNKLKPFKKIVIVGAGKIGSLVLKSLSSSEEEKSFLAGLKKVKRDRPKIAIIDSNPKKAEEIQKVVSDTLAFCGDATDESFLEEEGIPSYDLAICATHNHYLNMVLAAYLESLGVGQSIALVTSSTFAAIATKLGVDVSISLRDVVVDSVLSRLRGSAVREVHTITDNLEIIECVLQKGAAAAGVAVKDLSNHGKYLVLLVKSAEIKEEKTDPSSKENSENGEDYKIANGATVLREGDHLVLIAVTARVKEVLKIFTGV